jgi:folate-binding protein YgfZ
MDAAVKQTVLPTPLLEAHRTAGADIGEWFGCALPFDFGNWREEYRFARESVALLDKNYRSYLSFAGRDRVRYLNAILTNDIKSLKIDEGLVSLFLNPQGRIQAEIETYAEAERLFCVSFAMIREKLIPALDHYIIMDDVTLTDESARYGTLALEGPRAAEIVNQLINVSLESLPELGSKNAEVVSIPCRVVKRSPRGVPGAEFVCEQSHLSALWNLLMETAKANGGGPAGYTALNALRLEAGSPWFGYDFGDKQIPHEAGLEKSHISYTKGCYTGQEIVERVRSRGQVNRVRALFKLSSSKLPAPEAAIQFEAKEVGYVTRAAESPEFQAVIAMGYIRREQSVPGTEVQIDGASATVISPG